MTSSRPEDSGAQESLTVREGLLDLSIELSSPQVFSGSKFALYLHVKNPFSRPIWIRKVTTHLPSAVQSLEPETARARRSVENNVEDPDLNAYMESTLARLAVIQQRLTKLDAEPQTSENEAEAERLTEKAREVRQELQTVHDMTVVQKGYDAISLHGADSFAHIQPGHGRPIAVTLSGSDGHVRYEGKAASSDTVALHGALPADVALQPGGHNVWTLTLATKKNPFFLPAAYRFNVTVLYSFEPPNEEQEAAYSSTAPTTVNIRSSLWSVMAGSVTGGILGTIARILQNAKAFPPIFAFSTLGPMILSVTLSIAASIFAARKSETQSFVSVEDFWGGALIGFLIGYSGTAAFENLTRVQSGGA